MRELNFNVAGVMFRIPAFKKAEIHTGDRLLLEQEPENPHDPFAIKILAPDSTQIGYVPREYCAAIKNAIEHAVALEVRVNRVWANGANVNVTGTVTEERKE